MTGSEATLFESSTIAPRNDLERQLFEIWRSILERSSFGVTDRFHDLGGVSLRAVEVITSVETEFSVSLPPTQLYETPTIEKLAELLSGNTEAVQVEQGDPATFEIRRGNSRTPLFCFPGSGGNVSAFHTLAGRLGLEQGIHVVLYSELERETPPSSMEGLAASCLRGIRRVQSVGPYYLGGHSFGGSVAYEVARQLHASGEQVAMLALWDANLAANDTILFRVGISRALLHVRAVTLPRRLKIDYLRRVVEARLRALFGGTPETESTPWHIRLAVLDRIFRFQIAASEIHRRYKPRPFDGNLILYCAEDGTRKMDLSRWLHLARGGIEAYSIPGNHTTMLQEPNVSRLAEILQRHLRKSHAKPECLS